MESSKPPDCKSNGIPDGCELEGNEYNTNSIPDEREPDFDTDGLIDDCDPDIDDDLVLNVDDGCNFTPMGGNIIRKSEDVIELSHEDWRDLSNSIGGGAPMTPPIPQ